MSGIAVRPVRLRLSRRKGFNLQVLSRHTNGLACVNVARPNPWGNPFVVGADGNATQCVTLYRHLISGLLCLTVKASVDSQKTCLEYAADHIGELREKNLACWCASGAPCHADILLELANA